MRQTATGDRIEELEAKLRAKIGKGPEAYTRRDWVSLREYQRLKILYPNHHVAFRDHYTGRGLSRRLALREVVIASTSLPEVLRHVDALPDEELQGIFIEYVPGEPANRRGRRKGNATT